MEQNIIFCDGASKGNPGPGGWGTIVVVGDTVQELGGYEKETTNNRMELTAAVKGLVHLSTYGAKSVIVYTDSSYVINGITKWVHAWVRGGWKTKEKKEVLNQDLWRLLLTSTEAIGSAIEWKYVGGHVGIAGNEHVDAIASDFAQGRTPPLYAGSLQGYLVDIKNISFDKEKQKEKSDSRSRSKLKAYSYISEVGGEVVVHKTWIECAARVKGKRAQFKKSLSLDDEKKIVASFSAKRS